MLEFMDFCFEATHTANFTNLECRVTELWHAHVYLYNPHPYRVTGCDHPSTLHVPSQLPHRQRQPLSFTHLTETESCDLTKGLISNWLKQLAAFLILSIEIYCLSTYDMAHTEWARDNMIIISLNEENNFNDGENHEINYTPWVTWMHNPWEATHHTLHLLFIFKLADLPMENRATLLPRERWGGCASCSVWTWETSFFFFF